MSDKPVLDPNLAPEGYRAMLKTDIPDWPNAGNLCRHCDWRPVCQKRTEFALNERCSSYALLLPSGELKQRPDKCSVIFKRLP